MRSPATALAVLCLSATAAAGFELPDCAGLDAWGATGGPDYALNAATALPAAYGPEVTAATFGLAFLDWTRAEVEALDDALSDCRGVANSARDREAAGRFADLRRGLNAAGRTLRDIGTGRENVEKALAGIESGPQTPQLFEDLRALSAVAPADLRGLRTNLRDVAALARALTELPEAEQVAILGSLGELADVVGDDLTGTRLAEIAAVPATADGILALRAIAFAARKDLGDGAGEVVAATATRVAEIATSLAALPEAPILLPECGPLLAWAVEMEPGDSRATPAGRILTALESPAIATVFGKGFADWTAEDLALLGALAEQCRTAAREGMLGEDARERQREAQRVVELHARAANQPEIFAALGAGRQAAEALVAEAGAAPETVEGLATLQSVLSRIGRELEPADAERVQAAVAARRGAVVAAVLGGYRAGMEAAPASLDGIVTIRETLFDASTQPFWWQLTDEQRRGLFDAAQAAAESRAEAALPGFEAELAAIPATYAGLDALAELAKRAIPGEGPAWAPWRAAVAERRGVLAAAALEAELPAQEALWATVPETPEGYADMLAESLEMLHLAGTVDPVFSRAAERALVRAAAIRAALLDAHCGPLLDAAGLGSGSEALVLAGGETVPLGAFLCDLAGQADGTLSYDAPGFFGSEHKVSLMLPQGWQGTFVLREAEVRPGVNALVGVRAEEPTGARELSTAEWSEAATWLAGTGACRFDPAELLGATGLDPVSQVRNAAECLLANPAAPDPALAPG
jgi:hypothetical protein